VSEVEDGNGDCMVGVEWHGHMVGMEMAAGVAVAHKRGGIRLGNQSKLKS
jgi:hypothetical protein